MQNRYWKFALALSLLLGAAGCAAAPEPEPTPTPQPAPTASVGIAADTVVVWQKCYAVCDHTHQVEKPVEPEMVGKTLVEYAAYHTGYSVTQKGNQILLSRTIYQYCPDHYIIKDDGGVLALFRNENGEEELTRICRLRYQASDLPEDIRSMVYEGIPYGDIAELENMLKQVSVSPP
ncbi:MAG: hypothetical protein PHO66_02040 [Eubacteriales bacterium]|nr:hypothetical protein [Eubacteriales bacterium]